MDYSKYFKKLLEKQKKQKSNFPKKKEFEYREGKYHAQSFQYEQVRYNFVISSDRSTTYGNDFNGLIVEVYINEKNYYESYFNQLKIHQESIENELTTKNIVWQGKGESAKGTVCRIFAKKEVDLEDETKWDEYINWQIDTMIDFLKVMPTYTSKLEKKEIQEMDHQELESKFREYLVKMGHSQATLSTYPNMLKRDIPETMESIENTFPDTVFKIQNIEKLNNLYDRCFNGDLKDFNLKTQNRAPSAAIKKYISFLQSLDLTRVKNTSNSHEIKIKNLMLYGAPGVGKTYNYKNLITMIESGDKNIKEILKAVEDENDIEINHDLFNQIKKEDRIEFVTFHQSYSYEDFIEGYRPSEDEDRIVRKDGIFKIIAEKARINLENSLKDELVIQEEKRTINIFEEFCEYVSNKIVEDSKLTLTDAVYIYEIEEDAFRYKGDNWSEHERGLRMKFNDIFEFYKNDIQERKQIKHLEKISSLSKQHATYYFKLYQLFKEFKSKKNDKNIKVEKSEKQNYYIVIDEINRGNISKVFGELITLIEEDKRDKYSVTLPYSKEDFYIPSNLYIISTMNSTDKSIATIDIALRRRFTFIKMKPKYSLVEDNEARELMIELNEFIEDNIGEDYKLGHSYFMGEDIDLEFIRNYKLKPLLEEYFYADDEKLKKIMNLLNKEED